MKRKEGEISEIVTAACSSLTIGTALVRLWRKFGNDSPSFEAAATKADVSVQGFESAKASAQPADYGDFNHIPHGRFSEDSRVCHASVFRPLERTTA